MKHFKHYSTSIVVQHFLLFSDRDWNPGCLRPGKQGNNGPSQQHSYALALMDPIPILCLNSIILIGKCQLRCFKESMIMLEISANC